ncbi:hypothetical protein BGZ73_000304 [Actinomortierella ambigua]|nr:hypothetical protein BGZ73_000304 [Actinomortierella ambigua]
MHPQQFNSAPVVFDDDYALDAPEEEPIMNPDPYRVLPTGTVKDCCWRVPARLRLGYTCSPCFIVNGVFCRVVIDKAKATGHCGLFIQLAQDVPAYQGVVTLRGHLDVCEDRGEYTTGAIVATQEFNVKLARIGDAWGSSYMFSLNHIERFQTLLIDLSSVVNGINRRPRITHYNDPRHANLAIIDSNTREVVFYAEKKILETLVPTIHKIACPAWELAQEKGRAPDGRPLRRSPSSSWDSNEEGYHSGTSSKTSSVGGGPLNSDLPHYSHQHQHHPHHNQPQQYHYQQEESRRRRYNRTPPPIPTVAAQEAAEQQRLMARLQASSSSGSSSSASSPSVSSMSSSALPNPLVSNNGMENWVLRPHVSRKAFIELLDCVYNNSLPEIIHIVRAEEFLTLCRDSHLPYQSYILNLRGLMMRGIAPELLVKMLPIRAPETFVHVGNIIVSTIAAQWSAIPTKTKERLATYIRDPSGLLLPILLLLNGSAATDAVVAATDIGSSSYLPQQQKYARPSRRAY